MEIRLAQLQLCQKQLYTQMFSSVELIEEAVRVSQRWKENKVINTSDVDLIRQGKKKLGGAGDKISRSVVF